MEIEKERDAAYRIDHAHMNVYEELSRYTHDDGEMRVRAVVVGIGDRPSIGTSTYPASWFDRHCTGISREVFSWYASNALSKLRDAIGIDDGDNGDGHGGKA